MPKSKLLSLRLFREGGLSSVAGKIDRPDCRAALDGGNIEKVGDVFFGDSTTGAAGAGTVTSVLMIEASSDLGAIDPLGVGTRKGVLEFSCGNVILGRYDVGLGDCGVEGLVK